jgi:two-component system, response regulator PdtaR
MTVISSVSDVRPAVLVVEDDLLIRVCAMELVETEGYQAIGVPNADEAIQVLKERHEIRAVFSDIQMPGSMDGLDLSRFVKRRWPSMLVILTSGKIGPIDVELPDDVLFLVKPYLPYQLQTALHQIAN